MTIIDISKAPASARIAPYFSSLLSIHDSGPDSRLLKDNLCRSTLGFSIAAELRYDSGVDFRITGLTLSVKVCRWE